jgi:hypothetical protein
MATIELWGRTCGGANITGVSLISADLKEGMAD